MRFGIAEQLNLTDEQKQQARDIFQRLHDDIRQLRQDGLIEMTPDNQFRLVESSTG